MSVKVSVGVEVEVRGLTLELKLELMLKLASILELKLELVLELLPGRDCTTPSTLITDSGCSKDNCSTNAGDSDVDEGSTVNCTLPLLSRKRMNKRPPS